jgi:ParB/RepB/Spo0J family partition protein
MTTVAVDPTRVALSAIDVGENVRELDEAHVDALASSIALRGLIVPLAVRPSEQGRYLLVAGRHRYAACVKLGWQEVEVTVREQETTSADTAAENIVRKQLSPLGEARAVGAMLNDGLTLDGTAEALGWSRELVRARAKILELPETAQRLLDTGELLVSAVDPLLRIGAVSPALCEAAVAPVAEGDLAGGRLASDPGWAIGWALRNDRTQAFAAYLTTVDSYEIEDLRLGKKATAAYAECEELHRAVEQYAYGPPTIRFAESEVDQARAAGLLIEFEHGAAIITDRGLYRELVKQALGRTVEKLRDRKATVDAERAEARKQNGGAERTPAQELEAQHRATMRELTTRAHNTNLALGASLI